MPSDGAPGGQGGLANRQEDNKFATAEVIE
jgi:hypothetical protein